MIELQPDSAIRDRNHPNEKIEWRDAEEKIRAVFGKSVKHFSWLDKHPDKDLYLEICDKKMEAWRRRYGDDVYNTLEHCNNVRPTVDQYLRARHIIQTASTYPAWKTYTHVLRMRIDCAPTDIFPFHKLKTDNWKVYVQPSGMPFETRDQWFMGHPHTIQRIVEDFMEVYLTYHVVDRKGQVPKTILSPEFQLAQYLTRTKPYRLYKAHFDFEAKMLDGVQQFVVKSNPQIYKDNRVHFIDDTYQDYDTAMELEKTYQKHFEETPEGIEKKQKGWNQMILFYTVISLAIVLTAYVVVKVGFHWYNSGVTKVSVSESFKV